MGTYHRGTVQDVLVVIVLDVRHRLHRCYNCWLSIGLPALLFIYICIQYNELMDTVYVFCAELDK